ncbi:MAG: response regulator, partial [Chloroflexales bacterium]|nr:response regulator [Chloroflexales bacterium]
MATPMPGERVDQPRPAILVVDDEPAVTRTIARSLRDRFTVFTANTADVALNLIAREPIALILTDQRMPDMSGVQLLERARDLRPEALGILISGYTDASALVDALNLGNVRGFLPKPWDIHQLRRQIDQALRAYQSGLEDAQASLSTGGTVTRAQSQLAELRQALDQLNGGHFGALFEQWDRAQRDERYGPSRPHVPSTFFAGPPAGAPPISERALETFVGLVASYAEILDQAVEQRHSRVEMRRSEHSRALGERLGTLWAGPRDIVEIHTAALRGRLADAPAGR